MNKTTGKNDLTSAVPQFCFGLEVHRRTPEGRTRSAQEFLAHFFPYDAKSVTDRLFRHLPKHVRAPILTTWGVRGKKSALLDDDVKVQAVVHDALVSGDIDAPMFEEALTAETIMRWVDLSDWWTFWRGGKQTKVTISKVLESAYALELFDATWFLDTLRGGGGKLRGTDVLAEGLTKADLSDWVRRVHEGGDGSPKGLVLALGWDRIFSKTEDEVLLAVCDALAVKVSLTPEPVTKVPEKAEAKPEVAPQAAAPMVDPAKVAAKAEAAAVPQPQTKVEAKVEGKPEAKVEAKPAAKVETKTETAPAKAEAAPAAVAKEGPKPDAQAAPKGPVLPGILIPATAVRTDGEQAIDNESAANIFKDDELIPISSGTWEDGDESSENVSGERPARGSKPPQGKRASKSPPARGSK